MSPEQDATPSLSSPWAEFLSDLDQLLPCPIELHCLGGFVLTALYGLPRPTGDLDYIAALPHQHVGTIEALAGRDSELARKHRVHTQHVTVSEVPDNYAARLKEIFPERFSQLRLLALDPHDIVLSKLTRNHPVDDADVQFLVRKGILDPSVLRARYERELRPYLENQERHDATLKLWLEYF